MYHLSLIPDTPGPYLSGPNLNRKNNILEENKDKIFNLASKFNFNKNTNENYRNEISEKNNAKNKNSDKNKNGNENHSEKVVSSGLKSFQEGAKVRVTLEELHNGGRTFLLGTNINNVPAIAESRENVLAIKEVEEVQVEKNGRKSERNAQIMSQGEKERGREIGSVLNSGSRGLIVSTASTPSPRSSASPLSPTPPTLPLTSLDEIRLDKDDLSSDTIGSGSDSGSTVSVSRSGSGNGNLISYIRMTAFDRSGSKVLVDILDDQVKTVV